MTSMQVPARPASGSRRQLPAQSLSQQTELRQKPDRHSSDRPHTSPSWLRQLPWPSQRLTSRQNVGPVSSAWPRRLGTQVPAWHWRHRPQSSVSGRQGAGGPSSSSGASGGRGPSGPGPSGPGPLGRGPSGGPAAASAVGIPASAGAGAASLVAVPGRGCEQAIRPAPRHRARERAWAGRRRSGRGVLIRRRRCGSRRPCCCR